MSNNNQQENGNWGVTSDGAVASNDSMVSVALDPVRTGTLDEDAILIERFLSGELRAFDSLYTKYYEKVYVVARGILLDAEEAADTVQEVFTSVHRNLYKFDQRARFTTWLFRITVNRAIQDSRKRKRRPASLDIAEAAWTPAPKPHETDPRVFSAMQRLQPRDRALLLLYYWEDLSLQDIADSLGTNVNAAKTRLYRAREKFRAKYEEEA